jgi:hypothetical protein
MHLPKAGALLLPRLATGQIQFHQRRQQRQQNQAMHADQHQMDAQAGLAEHRRRHRDAHLHRIAVAHRDGAHRG